MAEFCCQAGLICLKTQSALPGRHSAGLIDLFLWPATSLASARFALQWSASLHKFPVSDTPTTIQPTFVVVCFCAYHRARGRRRPILLFLQFGYCFFEFYWRFIANSLRPLGHFIVFLGLEVGTGHLFIVVLNADVPAGFNPGPFAAGLHDSPVNGRSLLDNLRDACVSERNQ